MNRYTTARDLTAKPRVGIPARNKGRKPNRARRHRLNPGRRSRVDRDAARPAEAYAQIGTALAALAGMVC